MSLWNFHCLLSMYHLADMEYLLMLCCLVTVVPVLVHSYWISVYYFTAWSKDWTPDCYIHYATIPGNIIGVFLEPLYSMSECTPLMSFGMGAWWSSIQSLDQAVNEQVLVSQGQGWRSNQQISHINWHLMTTRGYLVKTLSIITSIIIKMRTLVQKSLLIIHYFCIMLAFFG